MKFCECYGPPGSFKIGTKQNVMPFPSFNTTRHDLCMHFAAARDTISPVSAL